MESHGSKCKVNSTEKTQSKLVWVTVTEIYFSYYSGVVFNGRLEIRQIKRGRGFKESQVK